MMAPGAGQQSNGRRSSGRWSWLLGLALGVGFTGCAVHRVDENVEPSVTVPDAFRSAGGEAASVDEWWKEFQREDLDRLVRNALAENLDLRQAWRRLAQARARVRIDSSGKIPQLDVQAGASLDRSRDSVARTPDGRETTLVLTSERYFAGAGLAYEVDLWRRIDSQARSASANYEATREDVAATALVLSGVVADLWLTIIEQRSLEVLLEQQTAVNQTQLELLELRFSVGEATALDVLQQRQQLAATRSEIPPVQARLESAENQLQVLLGRAPGAPEADSPVGALPELPDAPPVGVPAALLSRRPDLRAQRQRLLAADYEVGVAVADRLPRLVLSLSYDFSAADFSTLFTREIGSIAGNLMAPVIDGGRRRAEVERRREVVNERLDAFSQAFLNALLEVENALAQERHQIELLSRLHRQTEWARSNLSEAQFRYMNGLNDYLPVIAAIESVQRLERRVVAEQRRLLGFRTDLYLALGGSWMSGLTPPDQTARTASRSPSGSITAN